MRPTSFPDELTLGEARERFFRESGLGPDGDYSARWVKVELKPLPVYFPNTPRRVRAVKLHDLHHVVTGYDTTLAGEAEIGAWELASGCAHHYPAWILNYGSFCLGLFLAPRRLFGAFMRGRHSSNLYRGEFQEELLEHTVGEMRRTLLPERTPSPGVADVACFTAWTVSVAAVMGVGAGLGACMLRRATRTRHSSSDRPVP